MKILITSLTILVCFPVFLFANSKEENNPARYIKVPVGYLMVLREGDSIANELEKLAIHEQIPSANFTGMGFVTITMGFFNAEKREFEPKEFKNMELASMHGTIAWQKSKPSIHMHGVVTNEQFQAFGGHILSGTVGKGSLEIMIIVHDKKLERSFDDSIGANVLQLLSD